MTQLAMFDSTPERDWNPYFAAFARSLGVLPQDIAPGGPDNARYVGWIRGKRAEWTTDHLDLTGGFAAEDSHRWPDAAHDAFDAWLDALPAPYEPNRSDQ